MDISKLFEKDSYNSKERIADMSNIRQIRTGLDVIIWVETNGAERETKHNLARIKFEDVNTKNLIPISISKQPELLGGYNENNININAKQLQAIKKWIKENYDALMDLWKGVITTDDFIVDRIKKI